MRDRIKEVATELLITRGFSGTSFGEIAGRLAITTTNIHYHFGNKQGLVDEVVENYIAAARLRHLGIWEDRGTSLADKLQGVVDYNHERFARFNADEEGNVSWSLIGRLRLESELLSPSARTSLASFTDAVHDGIRSAIDCAWRRGELRDDTPREDLAFLIINIVNSSSVFTHGAGGFRRLRLFFEVFSRVTLAAYSPSGVR